MHSLPAEWFPVAIAPTDADLEVCTLGYDGIVHALVFPCHKDGAQWVDASNKERVDNALAQMDRESLRDRKPDVGGAASLR